VGVAQAAVALYGDDPAMPYAELAAELATQIRLLRGVLAEQKVHEQARERAYRKVEPDELARSLPGIAEIGAPLLVAAMGRPQRFRSAARFKAFTGLTPRHPRPARPTARARRSPRPAPPGCASS
jgi:transposase